MALEVWAAILLCSVKLGVVFGRMVVEEEDDDFCPYCPNDPSTTGACLANIQPGDTSSLCWHMRGGCQEHVLAKMCGLLCDFCSSWVFFGGGGGEVKRNL